MDRCPNCQSELRPEWKFCIHCGTAVASVTPAGTAPASVDSASVENEEKPARENPPGSGDRDAPGSGESTGPRDETGLREENGADDQDVPQALEADLLVEPLLSSYFPPDEFPIPVRRSSDDGLRRRIDIPLLAGILLAVGGVALIVYIIVVLTGTN